SMIPDLKAWMSSPRLGTATTRVVSAIEAILTSDCPAPTVSTMIYSKPQFITALMMLTTELLTPPVLPRLLRERIYTFGLADKADMRILSPRIAPPEYGLEGSTSRAATLCSRARFCTSWPHRVLLPPPGGPVTPITWTLGLSRGHRASWTRASVSMFSILE